MVHSRITRHTKYCSGLWHVACCWLPNCQLISRYKHDSNQHNFSSVARNITVTHRITNFYHCDTQDRKLPAQCAAISLTSALWYYIFGRLGAGVYTYASSFLVLSLRGLLLLHLWRLFNDDLLDLGCQILTSWIILDGPSIHVLLWFCHLVLYFTPV